MAALTNACVTIGQGYDDVGDTSITAGSASSGWGQTTPESYGCVVYMSAETGRWALPSAFSGELPRRRLKVWDGAAWVERDIKVKGLA